MKFVNKLFSGCLSTSSEKRTRSSPIPNCAFIISVERGILEAQAILLVESLRFFGGAYSNCPVYAISPRLSRQMSSHCVARFKKMGVHVIIEQLMTDDEQYGSVARLAACAWAEKNLDVEVIVSLDDDTFFCSEPDFSLSGVDFFARPVDLKGVCTSGDVDPYDTYWRKAALISNVDYDLIPWITSTIDDTRIKASYNGGMIAVRRDCGIFQEAERIFWLLREQNLSPYQYGELQVYAAHGVVSLAGSIWWGSAQVVLSLAVTRLASRVKIAPNTYNLPVHLLQLSDADLKPDHLDLEGAVLIHYHWLLNHDLYRPETIFSAWSDLPSPVLRWLKSRLPLKPEQPVQ